MPRCDISLSRFDVKVSGRVEFSTGDRLFFILLYRWFPSILKAITIIRPETVLRWHRLARVPELNAGRP